MLLKKSRILYEEVKTGDTGGAGGNSNVTPPPEVPPVTPDPTKVQAEGIKYDDYGYPIKAEPKAADKAGETPPPKEPPKEGEVKSGYEVPPVVPPEEPKPDDKKVDPPPADDKDKIVTDFGKLGDADKKVLGDYFDKHKLPKEARDEMVAMRQNEIAAQTQAQAEYKKQVEIETAKLKSTWYNELKNDKDFGGANFDINVYAVNNFMEKFLPGVKKMLTEKGSMLPPVVMKDYLNLAKKLNETEKFVQGDPDASETKQPGKYDFLTDFYRTN